MMKKLAALLLAAAMLLGVSPIAPAFALEAPGVTVTRDGAAVELVELGPDETVTLTASCPADWYIVDGAVLQTASAALELTWAALGFVQAGDSVQVAAAAADGEGVWWTSAPVTVTAVAPAQEPQLPQDPAEPQLPDAPVDIPVEEPPAASEPVNPYEEMPVEDLYALVMSLPTEEDADAVLSSLSETKLADLEAYAASQAETFEIAAVPAWSYTNVGPLMPAVRVAPAYPMFMAPAYLANGLSDDSGDAPEGLHLQKTATPDGNGGYTITLEAYTTGQVTTTSKSTPTDIVLVLDESGSMANSISTTEYELVYNLDTNSRYYVQDASGNFIRVKYCDGNHYLDSNKHDPGWYAEERSIIGHTDSHYIPKTSSDGPGTQFYEFHRITDSKRALLQRAANSFVDSVYADAYTNSVDHRVSVIGFSSSDGASTKIGLDNDIQDNLNAVHAAINGLNADGGTYIDKGLQNAVNVFNSAADSSSTERKRVVIVFTDGIPGYGQWGNNTYGNNGDGTTCANLAIQQAYTLKNDYSATVYTIGVLAGADPTATIDYGNSSNARTNRFLHFLSSNYPKATSMDRGGEGSNKGYYLTANDEASLNDIFNKISQEIAKPDVSLTEETKITDVVSRYFDMPADANAVSVSSVPCAGFGDNGVPIWNENGAQQLQNAVTITDNQVEVTGFDFNENFVANTDSGVRGAKLVIAFTVTPKAGFLGGNGVPTNAGATITTDDGNDTWSFPEQPTVDVPIPTDIQLRTDLIKDVNTYLSDVPTPDEITATLGDLNNPLGDLTWEDDFVNISTAVTVDPKADNTPYDAMEDGQYSLTVTVTPKSGTGESQSAVGVGNILVYAPEITISDMEIPLGDTPNFTDTAPARTVEWKHDTVTASPEMGTEPALSYNFAPAPNENNYKADTYVTATVKIKGSDVDVTGKCKFEHTDCTHTGCSFDHSQGQFIVHVIPFSLTIRKTGWNSIDENQSFVFKVTKQGDDNFKPLEVVIHGKQGESSVTINGLPKGTYTVTEESGWSWRYTADGTKRVTFSSITTETEIHKTVAVHNERVETQWLSGCAYRDNRWTTTTIIPSAPAEADNKSKKGVTD